MTKMALLTAAALILFTVEAQIPAPVPIPGVKLGLANIITVYAMFALGPADTLCILLARVFLGSVFSGAMVTLLYSLAGGLLCYLAMLLLRRVLTRKQIWVCGVAGAVCHNVGQMLAALAIFQSTAVLIYLPLLMLSGIAAGLFTGLCAQYLVARLDRSAASERGNGGAGAARPPRAGEEKAKRPRNMTKEDTYMEQIVHGRQYETAELCFSGPEPVGSQARVDLHAVFSREGKETAVRGFYAGDGVYKLRFLPEEAGSYRWRVSGTALPETAEGTLEAAPAAPGKHGPVRARGTHFFHADGTRFDPFGTTVYALAHQSPALIDETLRSLAAAPFNKIRICLFPKHYNYNFNDPEHYPFLQKPGREAREFDGHAVSVFPHLSPEDDRWDAHRPDFAFWESFEERLGQLAALGLQVDLILFHPYDRWGFAELPREENLVYLDYLLRRFAAFPNVWWSLANEYDLCLRKTEADWAELEAFVAANDPFRHLLSNHNCFRMWDAGREAITHVSWQTGQHYRIPELMRRWGKPVCVDECRYEGNVPEYWGNISGQEMTRRFWRVTVQGGCCTHGETFLPGTPEAEANTQTGEEDVVWWAKGGVLHGQSPARIAFLRRIVGELPGPLEPLAQPMNLFGLSDAEAAEAVAAAPEELRLFLSAMTAMDRRERDFFFSLEYTYAGHVGEDAFLWYLDDQCPGRFDLRLPEERRYRVELLDPWEMTRRTLLTGASGWLSVPMPGKPFLAVLALRE